MESENVMQLNVKREGDLRQWSKEEDEVLLDVLIEALNQGQKHENAQFEAHTLETAEVVLEQKFPGCGIKVKPDIESAMKRLRTTYDTIYDMLNQRGFDWDFKKQMIAVNDDVWNEYVKSHPNAKDYRFTQITRLDKLDLAFGFDCATGKEAVTAADVVEELDREEQNELGFYDDVHHLAYVNKFI